MLTRNAPCAPFSSLRSYGSSSDTSACTRGAGRGHEQLLPVTPSRPVRPGVPAPGLLPHSFQPALRSGRDPGARHYVGYSDDIERRVELHSKRHGSPLLAAVLAASIDFWVVHTWPGTDHHFERKLHVRRSRVCPEPECVPERRRCRRQLQLPLEALTRRAVPQDVQNVIVGLMARNKAVGY